MPVAQTDRPPIPRQGNVSVVDRMGTAETEKTELQDPGSEHHGGHAAHKETPPVDGIYSSGSDVEHTAGLAAAGAGDSGAGTGDDEGGSDDDTDLDRSPSVLDRVVSRVTSHSSIDPGPPPDGGWLAWSQCKSSPTSLYPYRPSYSCSLHLRPRKSLRHSQQLGLDKLLRRMARLPSHHPPLALRL